MLARSDLFPDALAGTPLACAQDAPLLITPAAALDSRVAAELRRVEQLRPQLQEVRALLADLEERSREVRTAWLLSQATSRRSAGHQP